MSSYANSRAYPWALTGIFAALHLVITLIPFSIGVGGGGEISFGLVSAPIVGFLLGPFYGVIAVLAGSLIAMFLNTSIAIIGPFTAIATAAGAFAAGAMRTKLRAIVPFLYIIAIGTYLLSPIGSLLPQFITFHSIIFILSMLFIIPVISSKLVEPLRFEGKFNPVTGFISLWLLSIVAVTLDNVVGSAIGAFYFIAAFGMEPSALAALFAGGIPLIPIERIVGSVIVTIILVALTEVLTRADFGLPLSRVGKFELLELEEEEE